MAVTHRQNLKSAIGIPLLIFAACYLITLTSVFKSNSSLLSNAIVLDLIVTAPLAYLIAIRKSTIPRSTVTRVFVAGLLVAGWILNAHSNALLHFIKIWISPAMESFVIFYISRKFYLANKKAKAENRNKVDFLIHCRIVMFRVIGNEKIGNMISSEIAVLYYTLFGRNDKTVDYKTRFTSHKENGIVLILAVFLGIFIIELLATHLIIHHYNKTAAWIISGLSFYTCMQLYAHIKAVKARLTVINSDSLEIHNGLVGDAFIQFDTIEKIELSNKLPLERKFEKIALIKGLENHNVIVYLKQPIQITKIFGVKKTTDTILFAVDKSKDFLEAINSKLQII